MTRRSRMPRTFQKAFLSLLIAGFRNPAAAWVAPLPPAGAWIGGTSSSPPRTTWSSSTVRLQYSTRDSQEEERRRQQRRMELVRSLQTQFYASSGSSRNRTALEDASYSSAAAAKTNGADDDDLLADGLLRNVPLWQVDFVEVPGRTNVWNVHEAQYTHMLESIVRSDAPWYVGHLYHRPKHSAPTAPTRRRNRGSSGLVPWCEASAAKNDSDVLGTLLRIVDYRRMDDGRLLVLVQALERFVVSRIVQELPFVVADLQVLPDVEEVDDSGDGTVGDWTETRRETPDVTAARTLAVRESFEKWHRYEFEQTLLPLPLQHDDLRADQVVGGALAKVLPYAPFLSVVNVDHLVRQTLEVDVGEVQVPKNVTSNAEDSGASPPDRTLEWQLWERGILRHPSPASLDPTLLALSSPELERRVWLALNEYLRVTKQPVSPILLGFLPHNLTWPTIASNDSDDAAASPPPFLLEQVAQSLEISPLQSKFVRLSPSYPALRRRKRLSYTVPALLEHRAKDRAKVHDLRRQLLAIPSTRVRLAYVLQLFLDTTWGAFE